MLASDRIEKELSGFIEFGGLMTQEQRKYMTNLMFRHFYDPSFLGPQELEASELPRQYPNWSQLLRQLMLEENLRTHTLNNEDFALSVTREAVNWFRQTFMKLESDHVLEQEEDSLKYLEKNTEQAGFAQWEYTIEQLLQWYPHHQQSWNFYLRQLKQLYQEIEAGEQEPINPLQQEKLSIVRNQILSDWKQFIFQKKIHQEESFLLGEFAGYYDSLKQKIDQLDLVGDLLAPYYSFFGHAWNNSLESWENINWDKMAETTKKLQQDPHLQTLAELLGRWQIHDTEQTTVQMTTINSKPIWTPNPIGKSEIIGVHHSDQLSAMLPSEVALLGSPETELVFSKKFVEKKLLTFHFYSKDLSIDHQISTREIPESDAEKRGPLIMCVDTSGSMYGEPEKIAKALAFGILDIALKEKRKAYLISFSTTFEQIELTGMEEDFERMAEFLQMSFHGGTDLQPPLRQTLKMLEKEHFERADVLVISDFVLPAMDRDIFDRIQEQRQQHGTHFHSMLITRRPDPRTAPLPVFDHHWVYDLENPKVLRQTYDHFQELKNYPLERDDDATVHSKTSDQKQ